MKGMIFAAGLGTRLAPLTDHTPKALIEVGGLTMLERVIRRMESAGVGEIVVNVHHHAGMIEQFVATHSFKADVRISSEHTRLLDTGGGVLHAAPLLLREPIEPILLYNADIYTDFPIEPMLEAHMASGADATLLVSPDRVSSRRLLFTPQGRLAGWTNLNTGEVRSPQPLPEGCIPMAFGGVHIVEPKLFDDLAAYAEAHGPVFSLTPFYTDTCARRDYRAYIPGTPYRWIDIGKPETLAEARKLFACK